MARIVQVDEVVGEGAGQRRPLWINADHVAYFRAGQGATTELTLTTGETLRLVGDPKSYVGKFGLPLGRVLGAGV